MSRTIDSVISWLPVYVHLLSPINSTVFLRPNNSKHASSACVTLIKYLSGHHIVCLFYFFFFFFFNETSRLLFHLSFRQSRDGFSERNEGSSKIFESFTPPLLADTVSDIRLQVTRLLLSLPPEGAFWRFQLRLASLGPWHTAPTSIHLFAAVVYLSHPCVSCYWSSTTVFDSDPRMNSKWTGVNAVIRYFRRIFRFEKMT